MCVAGITLIASDPIARWEISSYTAYALFVILAITAFLLGRGLHRGNRLAIKATPIAGFLISGGALYWCILELSSPTQNLFDMVLFPTLVLIGLYVQLSYLWSRSKVSQWATNAQLIRSEQTQPPDLDP